MYLNTHFNYFTTLICGLQTKIKALRK